jgi:hypothetical protein
MDAMAKRLRHKSRDLRLPVSLDLLRKIVRAEVDFERARMAAEEADQWKRAFAAAGPAYRKARNNPIIRLASTRALLANMNKPP